MTSRARAAEDLAAGGLDIEGRGEGLNRVDERDAVPAT
jgi:hypothetical protein